jgi:hypothetical protein
MIDGPDGSGQIPRRTTRVSDGGAPVSGALAIVLAVVAVVAGFLILRSISDGGEQAADFPGSGSATAGSSDSQDVAPQTTDPIATLPTTTTLPTLVKTGASVIVANANGVGGSASSMSRALATDGFTMIDAVNSAVTIGDIDVSVIYFEPSLPAAEVVANSLATVLGGVETIAPMPETPPTRDGTLNGASVLLMLGNDKAGKTLAELAPELSSTPPPVTNPPIVGGVTTTTTG